MLRALKQHNSMWGKPQLPSQRNNTLPQLLPGLSKEVTRSVRRSLFCEHVCVWVSECCSQGSQGPCVSVSLVWGDMHPDQLLSGTSIMEAKCPSGRTSENTSVSVCDWCGIHHSITLHHASPLAREDMIFKEAWKCFESQEKNGECWSNVLSSSYPAN